MYELSNSKTDSTGSHLLDFTYSMVYIIIMFRWK